MFVEQVCDLVARGEGDAQMPTRVLTSTHEQSAPATAPTVPGRGPAGGNPVDELNRTVDSARPSIADWYAQPALSLLSPARYGLREEGCDAHSSASRDLGSMSEPRKVAN